MDNTFIENATNEIATLGEEFIFCDLFSQVAEEIIIDGQSNDEQVAELVILEAFPNENNEELSETICDNTNYTQQLSPIDELNVTDCTVEEEIIVDEQVGEGIVVQVQYVDGNFLEMEEILNKVVPKNLSNVSKQEIVDTDHQEQHVTPEKETTSSYQRSFEKHIKVFYPKDGKAFKCRQCNLQYPTLTSLSNHCKTIHNHITKRHGCEFCFKFFIWQCDLKRHSKLCPQNSKTKQQKIQQETTKTKCNKKYLKKPYICSYCTKSFAYRSQWQNHLKKHTGEPSKQQFNCVYCNKSFSYSSQLDIHLRKHTGQTPKKEFVCNYCYKSFAYNSHLKLHLGVHTGEQPKKQFNCNYCDKSFGYKSHLEIHIRRHTGEGPKKQFNCNYCTKTFPYNSHLLLHLKKHTKQGHKKQYNCNICNKTFGYRSHLESHQRIHTDERPYSCAFCDKSFRTKNNLIEHQSVHTDATPLACFLCEKVFKNQKSLNAHQKRCNSKYNKYKCQDCNACFRNRKTLITHQKTHNSAKHVCEYCCKSFDKLFHLKFHLGVHTGERPLLCTVCDVAFKDRASLRNHKKTHLNLEKTYLCEICSKAFLTMLSLKKHYAAHSEERPFSCCWCGNAFKSKGYVLKHKRRFHAEQESKVASQKLNNCNKETNDCNNDLLNKSNDCIYDSFIEPKEELTGCINILLKDPNDNELIKESNDCDIDLLSKSNVVKDLLTALKEETIINDLLTESNDNELLKESNDCINDLLKELKDDCKKDLIMKSNCENKDVVRQSNKKSKKDLKIKSNNVKKELRKTEKHVCEKCLKTFDKRNNLRIHYKIHSEERPYSCDLCKKTFKDRNSLRKHEKVHLKEYSAEHRYQCSLCERAYKDKRRWQEHERRHLEPEYRRDRRVKKHICEICSMKFGEFNHYQRHVKLHAAIRPHHCSLCEKGFFRNADLKYHLTRSHTEEEIKTFKNRVNIRHICEYCNKICVSISELKNHLIVHTKERRHTCGLCEKTYLLKNHLSTHLVNSHSEEEINAFNKEHQHDDNKVLPLTNFICVFCNKCFSCNSQLQRHLMVHTKVRPYPCELCDKDYRHKSHLNRHLANNHTKAEVNALKRKLAKIKYCCKFCDKSFEKEYLLNCHQKQHLKLKAPGNQKMLSMKNISCRICFKSFKRLNKLTNHLRRIHQTERNCVKKLSKYCDVCKKIFRSHLHLVIHIRHIHPNYEIKKHRNYEVQQTNYKKKDQTKTNEVQKKNDEQNYITDLCEISDCTLDICKENPTDLIPIIEVNDIDPKKDKQNAIVNADESLVSAIVNCNENLIDLTPITAINDIDPLKVKCKENLSSCGNNNYKTKDKSIKSVEILSDSEHIDENIEDITNENTNEHHETIVKPQTKKNTGKKKYICEICSVKFAKFIPYKRHIKFHSLKRPYPCTLCDKAYLQKAHLNRHMKNSHSKQSQLPHICANCNKSFNSISQLKRHLMIHIKNRLFTCNQCKKSYKHEYLLKYHHRSKHLVMKITDNRIKSFRKNKICKICSKSFDRLYKLTIHLRRIHQTERNRFKKSNENQSLTNNDIEILNTQLLTTVEYSEYMADNSEDVINLENNNNLCTDSAAIHGANYTDLLIVETNENQSLTTNVIQTNTQLLTTVEDSEYMEDNSEDLIYLENNNELPQQLYSKSEHLFHCSICEIIFKDKSSLNNHQRIHVKSPTKNIRGEKKYFCEICFMKFSKYINYKKHSKLHSADRPYPCVLCDKAYLQNYHLNRHLATSHSKEEVNALKQESSALQNSFNSSSHRKRHLIVHTKKQKYSCNLCKKMYKHEYLLKYHRKKHFEQKLVNNKTKASKKKKICKICGKTFDRLHKLHTHFRRLHKTKSNRVKQSKKSKYFADLYDITSINAATDSEDSAEEFKLENNENLKVQFCARSDYILDHLADTTIIDISKTDNADEDNTTTNYKDPNNIIRIATNVEENPEHEIANNVINIGDNHNVEYYSNNYKTKGQKITLAEILKESVHADDREKFHSEFEIKDEPLVDNTNSNGFSVNLLIEKDYRKESPTQPEPKIVIQNIYYSTNENYKEKSIVRHDTDTNTDQFIYSCSVCKNSFKNEFLLKFHQKKHSTQPTTGFSRDLLRQKRICRYCFKFFDGLSNLNNHINRVHLRKANDVKMTALSTSCAAPEEFQLTPISFDQNDHLNSNFQKKISIDKLPVEDNCNHSNINQKDGSNILNTNVCKLCSKSFANSYNLNRHLRIHTRKGPYSCSLCKISYKDKRNLVRHQKKHVENCEENLIELIPVNPVKDLDPLTVKSKENNSSIDSVTIKEKSKTSLEMLQNRI